jgi:hypothetical protein
MKILRRLPISTTRPIRSIIVLAGLLVISSVPAALAVQKEWQGADCSWDNPGNWSPPGVPGSNDNVVVLPSQPGPCITGNAKCSMLSLNPWDPTAWGGQDAVVTITETALDVNFGAALQINSQVDYDSKLGGETLVSRAIVNVYGGTVTTPNAGSSGIAIGGGSSTSGDSYGVLNIYGGLVSVPRIAIYYGDVNLYGGTLECTTDPNFVFRQDRPENRINVNGGTLKLKGNHATELGGYITNGRIVCIRGGELGAPVYDGTWTTLSGTVNFNLAWDPQPTNNATNVHYKTTDVCSITLGWQPGDLAKQHDVYFGTSFADVNSATTASPLYKGSRYDANGDPHNWTITGPFIIGASYYWRIDETNDSNVLAQGQVWKFTTHNGKAYNPRPINGATALGEPLQLSWTAGDWADSHRVFFCTASPVATNTSDPIVYRGTQSGTVYNLKNLLPNYILSPGTTYYWRVVEVNTTYGTAWASPLPAWSFTTAAYVNIDDFEDYNSTDDVNANWPDGYTLTGDCLWDPNIYGYSHGYAGRALIHDANGKYLRYTYTNGGGREMVFSEARRSYSGGTSFTGGGALSPSPKVLRIDYRGVATNSVNPVYDRMYVAIEDTAGNVAVYQNPDTNAARVGNWTSWHSNLYGINALGVPAPVNLEAISGFAIGFGVRCRPAGTGGGDGNVMFDNIRLYTICGGNSSADFDRNNIVDWKDFDWIPEFWLVDYSSGYAPITAPIVDLYPDCVIDFKDFAVFANQWLTDGQ